MFVQKCKSVMMEERRGRRRARKMAREVAGLVGNPIGAVTGFAGNAVNSVAGEDMGGGAKVLLLLVGAGVIGGGIYYLATKPAAAATSSTAPPSVVNPGTTAPTPSATANASVTITAPNGQTITTSGNDAYNRAVTLAKIGQKPSGVWWATVARTHGISAAQSAQLSALGY